MGNFREIPPTAGIPIYRKDLFSLFKVKGRNGSLEDDFKRYLGVNYARLTCSGTAALYLLLESLKNKFLKRTVVIPSYACPLIPLAIKRAGFKVEVCDINRDNFDFNHAELEDLCRANDDLLAIIAVHLAGIPVDFDFIKNLAEKHKILVIEDCAQSLGSLYKGKKVGTLGDFSFFSLCRGKGVTTYEGGMIVTNKEEFGVLIDSAIKKLVDDDFISEALLISGLIGYWIFYRPLLFWFVFRLPQIFWNWRGQKLKAVMEDFDIDFPVHSVSKIRQLIGHAAFHRLEQAIYEQREKASFYSENLKKIKGIKIVGESAGATATYPFLTLVFDDPLERVKALKIFDKFGLGASQVYALAIADYEYLKDIVADRNCTNARWLAERELTLSTSTFLDDADLNLIVDIVENL